MFEKHSQNCCQKRPLRVQWTKAFLRPTPALAEAPAFWDVRFFQNFLCWFRCIFSLWFCLCPKAKQKTGRGSPICPKKDDYLQLPITYACKHIRLIETLSLQGNRNIWHWFHLWTLYLSKVTENSETWGVRSGLVMSGVRSGALISSDVVCEVEWEGMWEEKL